MTTRILIGDLHFGEHHNSDQHNQDLLDFLDFVIAYAASKGIRRLSCLGDYFDNRSTLGVSTISYAMTGVDKLREHFTDSLNFLPGNHDLFYKDSRDITSLEIFRDKVSLIESLYFDAAESTLYVPWVLSDDEYQTAVRAAHHHKARFVFGHFEANTFRMNNKFTMEGGQDPAALAGVQHVFSSHYHDRQTKHNFTYIGNPFPFDYGDANATERGFCVVNPDTGTFEFVNYDAIRIISMAHTAFLSPSFTVTNPKTSIKVVVDEVISPETTQAIQDKLESLTLRQSQVVYNTSAIKELINQDVKAVTEVKNLDELVIEYLTSMNNVEGIDKELLVGLYREAAAN